LPAGTLDVALLTSGTLLSTDHTVDEDQFEPGKAADDQAHIHELELLLANVSLNVRAGLSDRFGVGVFVPLRVIRIDASFKDDNGKALASFDSIHHRTETLTGVGDIRLSGHVRLVQPQGPDDWTMDARLGFTLPTGNIEPDPFVLGRDGQSHQHMFFGHGTFDPTAGLQASRALGSWRLQAFAGGRMPVYENRHGYRGPSSFSGGIGMARGLGDSGLVVQGQLSAFHEIPAKWSGADARNSGRTDVIGVVGASFPATKTLSLIAMLRVPWVLQTQGGQLSLSPTLVLGLATRLPVW
jgi:hypothetical protein